MERRKRTRGGGGKTLWSIRCPLCLTRLPYGWTASRSADRRDILARHIGGDRGIRVVDSLSYSDEEGRPFLRAWVQRLREVLDRLDPRSDHRWVLRSPVYIPRVVESYSRSREPEPTVSGTGRLLT